MLEQILTMSFLTAFLTAAVRMAAPLIYAGLGEVFLERAGILNIGLEGVMLGGAFFSFAGAYYGGGLLPGLLAGMAGGTFSQRDPWISLHSSEAEPVRQRNRPQHVHAGPHQLSL